MADGLMTPRQAATMLGVSYVTVKGWILRGSLPTVKTPGGHHRIAQAALDRFRGAAGQGSAGAEQKAEGRQISGRNQLPGVVTEVTVEGLLARVRVRIGEQTITAIITSDAVRELKLRKGDKAAALIKATEVMIAKLD
jgi:molybdopterin-binding protein